MNAPHTSVSQIASRPTGTLRAHALAIGFAGRTLAKGIAFSLEAGRTLAVLGPNGSGKTTLLRTLLGLQPPRAGEVELDGQPISRQNPREVAQHIAHVAQARSTLFNFRVIEMVELARAAHMAWYARPSAEDRIIALRALDEVGIPALADRIFGELSGGEQQLVLIARALASEARILLLDEPTASLDFGNQILMLDVIAKLKSHGYAILFTTHDPRHAYEAADVTLTLARDGKVHFGATEELLTPIHLATLYGVDAHHFAHFSPDQTPLSPGVSRHNWLKSAANA
jgi:iron complex transport system ATP-binding protein